MLNASSASESHLPMDVALPGAPVILPGGTRFIFVRDTRDNVIELHSPGA